MLLVQEVHESFGFLVLTLTRIAFSWFCTPQP
jgi:hypothetical protein